MEKPDWLQVLTVFYEENLGYETDPSGDVPDFIENHDRLTHIDDVANEIQKLHTAGLLGVENEFVRQAGGTVNFMTITETGFEAVHESNLKERQNQSNRLIIALTLVLATSATAQALANIMTLPTNSLPRAISGLLLSAGLIVFLVFFRKDIWRYIRG
jgi:hypothetical protein